MVIFFIKTTQNIRYDILIIMRLTNIFLTLNYKKTALFIVKKFFLYITLVYFGLGLVLFFNQNNLIFFPDDTDFQLCPAFLDLEKINQEGTRFYYHKNIESETLVVFYHGNAGSACDRTYIKNIFELSNVSYIIVEYTGYSNDTIQVSKNTVLNDVQNIHNFIEKLPAQPKKLYIMSESVGTGASTFHTTLTLVDRLILISAYSSLSDVAYNIYPVYPMQLMLRDDFNNIQQLKDYRGEVYFIHGDTDNIIPIEIAQKLYQGISTDKKEFYIIKNVGHNDMFSATETWEVLSKTLQ